MFERKKYKSFAKKQLSGRWGIPIAITIIVGAISCLFALPEWTSLMKNGYFSALYNGDYYSALDATQTAILTSDWYKRYKTEDVYSICVDEINKFIG